MSKKTMSNANQRKAPEDCACGSPIPWHLFELGLTSNSCMCGRKWSRIDDKTVKMATLDTGWRGV